MKKIMFNDKYGLTKAVLEGRKTQTRRICVFGSNTYEKAYRNLLSNYKDGAHFNNELLKRSLYKVGEEVAVAQSYHDAKNEVGGLKSLLEGHPLPSAKGINNKMFVKADLMPHRIKITNIRIERLQDISEEDALNEGLEWTHGIFYVNYNKETGSRMNLGNDYRNAFATLIDNVSGKGTWQSNPWVFVYDFELIK